MGASLRRKLSFEVVDLRQRARLGPAPGSRLDLEVGQGKAAVLYYYDQIDELLIETHERASPHADGCGALRRIDIRAAMVGAG